MQLSKSGKAVFINTGLGRNYCTSVAFIKMLIEGKAHGNIIMLTEMINLKDNGIGSVVVGDKDEGKPKSGFEAFQ